MDIEIKEYLSNLFTYMSIMDSINKKLNKLEFNLYMKKCKYNI